MEYNQIITVAFVVGLFISLWLLTLADILRRFLFLHQATEKAFATVISRHTEDRISWDDYYISLSFETQNDKVYYHPHHAVSQETYETVGEDVTVLYVPENPRQCLVKSELAYERHTNYILFFLAILGTVAVVVWSQFFWTCLALTMKRDPNSILAPVLVFMCMLSWGFYGAWRILQWKTICPYCGVKDPYYRGATLVDKCKAEYESV